MKVVACQFAITWENPEANFATVSQLLESTEVEPGSLIVLPEMFATGFSMNVDRIANNPLVRPFLSDLARRYQSWLVGGYVSLAPDGRGLNQALVYDPQGAEIGSYNKVHPFSFAGEDKVYAAGESLQLVSIGGFTMCPLVCYDLRFPELFRAATVKGADFFVVIANWPEPRTAHWSSLLQARAIENQAFVVGVNRTGRDPKLTYAGHSCIISPKGDRLIELGDAPGAASTDIELHEVTNWRTQFPALQDIRFPFHPKNESIS